MQPLVINVCKYKSIITFQKKFIELIEDVDEELTKSMGLNKFLYKINKNFNPGESLDVNIKNLVNIFNDYIEDIDKNVDKTYNIFEKKIKGSGSGSDELLASPFSPEPN